MAGMVVIILEPRPKSRQFDNGEIGHGLPPGTKIVSTAGEALELIQRSKRGGILRLPWIDTKLDSNGDRFADKVVAEALERGYRIQVATDWEQALKATLHYSALLARQGGKVRELVVGPGWRDGTFVSPKDFAAFSGLEISYSKSRESER